MQACAESNLHGSESLQKAGTYIMIEIMKDLGTFLFYFVASLGGAALVCGILTTLSIKLMDGIDHMLASSALK